jgi:hypothetical protein
MAWHPESDTKRKRWAALQAAWAKAQGDFRDLGWGANPLGQTPAPPQSEADASRPPRRPAPAPLGRTAWVRRGVTKKD